MRQCIAWALLFTATTAGAAGEPKFLRFTSAELWISGWHDEATVTREHLMEIRSFILAGGYRETFGSAYNDNPAHRFNDYGFYLVPDSGQDTYCDPKICGFHYLLIRHQSAGWDSSRSVVFRDPTRVGLSTYTVREDLSVGEIQGFVAEAMGKILAGIDGDRELSSPLASSPPTSRILRIDLGRQDPRWDNGTIVRHENLETIRRLLLQVGQQATENYSYFLEPIAPGDDGDDETGETDRQQLRIQPDDGRPDVVVDSSSHRRILLQVAQPEDDLTAGEVLRLVADAISEILRTTEQVNSAT